MTTTSPSLPATLALALAAVGCGGAPSSEAPAPGSQPAARAPAAAPTSPGVEVDRVLLGAFDQLPEAMTSASNPVTPEKVALGRMMYHDTRFSLASDVSCNTCHDLANFGVDSRPRSPGHEGRLGARNSPTVYNAAGHVAQSWDGRAADVEEQAKGCVLNPAGMAMPSPELVLARVRAIPGYVEAFAAAFPGDEDPVSYDNFGQAIGAFERRLVTPGRWDAYLAGDDGALTDAEKQGLLDFVRTGCTACHAGTYLGGHVFQKAGLAKPWPDSSDVGRFEVTGDEADRFVFKVPSLRNVARTGPWFHDGSVADLSDAVRVMVKHQLGKQLDDGQVKSIVTFLEALTGELPTDSIAKPELPPTGPGGLPDAT